MSSIQDVYQITEQLVQLVENPIPKDNRDDFIEKITLLLSEREYVMAGVEKPVTGKEKELANKINSWNETIIENFKMIQKQIQQDMMQLKKTKTSNNQYTNPYQQLSVSDGMYYDKRK